MAAALVGDLAPQGEAASLKPLYEFLKTAVSLYRAVWSVHQHGDDDDGSDASSSDFQPEHLQATESSLRRVLPELLATANDPNPSVAAIFKACYRIGQDLVLRLQRLQRLELLGPGARVGQDKLCAFWSRRDIETLGLRLDDIRGRCQEVGDLRRIIELLGSERTYFPTASDVTEPSPAEPDERRIESPKKIPSRRLVNALFKKDGIAPKLPERQRQAPASLLNDFILESLAYKSMHDREEEVVKAHSKTFEWVFTKADSSSGEKGQFAQPFTAWLETNDLGPIYWITGKPGSGKSTFMRFLFHHPSTWESMDQWANGQPIAKAGFFFWTSGSREQRSQTGLLRSVLHQLLSSNMELMPDTLPNLWEKLQTMSTKDRIKLTLDWTVPELMDAFQRFIDAALPHMKLCLFVDGLDEFEGDHHTIIDFFKNLSLGPHGQNIKMCLSSRPWAVFENAFQYAVPNLRLQDLTYEDMYRYAKDRLRADTQIRRLFGANEGAEKRVISDAIQRADGVFLWMRLAINEILEIPKTDINLETLATFLRSLPTELDQLFTKLLLDDQTEAHVSEAAIIFQLMTSREIVADFVRDDSANALTIWEIAFATDRKDDTVALDAAVVEASDETIRSRCTSTVDAIRKSFAGLLDLHARQSQGNMRGPRFADAVSEMENISGDPAKRVTYIHRTVRDWLMEGDGVYDRLVEKAPAGFDPHLRLLRSYVLRLKNPLEEIEHHRRLDDWWPDIAIAMTHARHIAIDPESHQRLFLNELSKTLSWYWLHKPRDPYDHWARNAFGSYEMRMQAAPIWQPFLCLAAKFGLTEYLREELGVRVEAEGDGVDDETRELETTEATPLLSYATEFLCSRNTTIFPLSNPRLIDFLLRNPSRLNPSANHEYNDFTTRKARTPWIALLRHLRDSRRRGRIEYYDLDPEGVDRWAEIVRLFVEVGGADVDAVVVEDRWDPEVSALGVMEMLDETYHAVEMKELRDLVAQMKEKA